MSSRVQRIEVDKFKIFPNSSFIWEMVAWAVVVSIAWTLRTIEENQYTPVTFAFQGFHQPLELWEASNSFLPCC